MIGLMCRFYSFSYEDVMRMPVRAFFALYREGIKLQFTEYRELARIQAISIQQIKYYNELKELYDGIIDPTKKELPPLPQGPTFETGSEEAKLVLMETFRSLKRGLGYGR